MRNTSPLVFFPLHLSETWPVGVIGLAVSSSLVKAGVSVEQTAGIAAAALVPFSFEFLLAPLVDSCWTRKGWYVLGISGMCASLLALLVSPWKASSVPLITTLAVLSCSGAAVAAVSTKGLLAYEIPPGKLGIAGGACTAGGTFAKAVAGAGTLWMLTHLNNRPWAAMLSVGTAAIAATAILLVNAGERQPIRALVAQLRIALADAWNLIRSRSGALLAVLCVIPFGSAGEVGLIGAIAREWSVSPDQLAAFGFLGAVTGILGALGGGLLSNRIGAWKAYIILGWVLIAAMLILAAAPRVAWSFIVMELGYRGVAGGCTAALLGLVMTGIGKGAASTKAAALWSLANFSATYPTVIEGAVHDHLGTEAMLLSDAGLGVLGFTVLALASSLLRPDARVGLQIGVGSSP